MPFETVTISSYEPGSMGPNPKSSEKFAAQVTAEYERIRSLGGEVVSHEVVKLKASFEVSPGQHIGKIDPVDHAVIVASLPE